MGLYFTAGLNLGLSTDKFSNRCHPARARQALPWDHTPSYGVVQMRVTALQKLGTLIYCIDSDGRRKVRPAFAALRMTSQKHFEIEPLDPDGSIPRFLLRSL